MQPYNKVCVVESGHVFLFHPAIQKMKKMMDSGTIGKLQYIYSNRLPRSEFPQIESTFYEKTLIKKSASFGANATSICGVTIGGYALIGSGAVVTKDIPDFSLVVGNPGRVVGLVDKKGNRVK